MGSSFEPSCSPAVAPGAGKAGTALGVGKLGICNATRPGLPLPVLPPAGSGQSCCSSPRVCVRGSVFSTGLLSLRSGLNGEFFSKRQRPEAVILFLSDVGLLSCVINFNRDFCVNRVAVEEFNVQTPHTGTEEPMPISSQIAWVGVRLISKPRPFKTTAASVLAFVRDVVAGGGEGRRLSHYASAARVVFGTHSLRAAGFA